MIQVTLNKIDGTTVTTDLRGINSADVIPNSLRPLTANNGATAAVFKVNAVNPNGVPIIQELQVAETFAAVLAALTADIQDGAPINSPTFTGVPAAPTAAPGTNTTQLATTAFVFAADALKANIASPTFTGVPAAPTASAGTTTTQVATTQFVQNEFSARSAKGSITFVAGVAALGLGPVETALITATSRVFLGDVTALNATPELGVACSVVNVAGVSCTVTMLKADGTAANTDVSTRAFTIVF